MRIGLLGGLRVEHDGRPIVVSGAMQLGVFFRLAVDAGTPVSVREIVEDVWGIDAPENERAALQSVVSRLRAQLPSGAIASVPGGYQLAVAREDVDALLFQDRVAAGDPTAAELWTGDPWIPSDNFDWFARDLRHDRSTLRESSARTTIAAPLTSLVGREAELATIGVQLAANRLVTVVGTGGAGKTRLAVEAARDHGSALFVELAPVGPDEILPAVLTASGRELRTVDVADLTTTRQRVLESLRGREVLLVLDNCEHIVDAAAAVTADLLGALPGLRILATSREPLAIPGEAFVAVGALPRDEALELFRQRAVSACGTEPDSELAAAICARLDGLPLAIELAAAKLRTMTLGEVVDGLEHRFTLLTGGYRSTLPRHQTLRAMIDWSWSLLTDDERALLTQLAVFPAGIAVGDTASLASALGVPDVADALVDRSLLQRVRGRYRALETIREYGLDRLAEQGTMTDARATQVRHQAASAVRFDRLLRGPRIHDAIAWFDAEEDNIAAALRFTTAEPLADTAVTLAMSCAWYWVIRERQEDATAWFPLVMGLAEQVEGEAAEFMRIIAPVVGAFSMPNAPEPDEALVSELLEPLGRMVIAPGGHEVLQMLPAAVAAYGAVAHEPDWMLRVRIPRGEDLGLDPWPTAVLHVVAAATAHNRGDIGALGDESQTAVAAFGRIGDLWGLAIAQQMRSEWLAMNGRLGEALALSDESTANMRRITTTWDLAQQQALGINLLVRLGRVEEARARALDLFAEAEANSNSRTQLQAALNLVGVEIESGDLEGARALLELIDALVLEDPPNPRAQMGAWIGMAHAGTALLAGETDAAEDHLRTAAADALASRDQPVIAEVALGLGMLAVARGDVPTALRAADLATAILGIRDATHPKIVAIEAAAAANGIERAGAEAPTRSTALEAFAALSA